jgi:hypothetical protein
LRQYPVFWWTPEEVGQKLRRRKWNGDEEDGESEKGKYEDGSESTLAHELGNNVEFLEGIDQVSILPYLIRLPRHIELGEKEIELLQKLQDRVREHSEVN